MSHSFGLVIESMVSLLLALTIVLLRAAEPADQTAEDRRIGAEGHDLRIDAGDRDGRARDLRPQADGARLRPGPRRAAAHGASLVGRAGAATRHRPGICSAASPALFPLPRRCRKPPPPPSMPNRSSPRRRPSRSARVRAVWLHDAVAARIPDYPGRIIRRYLPAHAQGDGDRARRWLCAGRGSFSRRDARHAHRRLALARQAAAANRRSASNPGRRRCSIIRTRPARCPRASRLRRRLPPRSRRSRRRIPAARRS